jgi:hypothetical protein
VEDSERPGGFRQRLRAVGREGRPAHDQRTEQLEDLELQVLLLREENARLRMAGSGRARIGGAIEEIRRLELARDEQDLGDDMWSAIAELLVLREGIDAACAQMETALAAVRERLSDLSMISGD